MSASPPLKSKKEVLDTADPQQVPTRVLSTRWLKRDEEKMKYCSRSTPLPTQQLMLQPILRLMLQQTLRPLLLAMSVTMQLMLPTYREMQPQTQETMQELSLLQSWLIGQKEADVTA
jgi:hypothetical protein